MRWVERQKFDRLGCFTYSHEENTHAFALTDDVPDEEKHRRVEAIMSIQEGISLEKNEARIGQIYKTLMDRAEDGHWIGRTEFDSPDVDNEVRIAMRDDLHLRIGDFANVKITGAAPFDLDGQVVD
jgi:ribosomal protein S12 methylthiotransferase